MKVFISWSGERSRTLAEALRDWLPKVIQAVNPWMSAVDIERGARWMSDISTQLEQTRFGILCLTPENLDAPWIHFEAGALSKTIETTFVCPYLLDLDPTDLKGPLVQFNAARANKEETEKLILTLNAAQQVPLTQENISESFELWWPKLEMQMKEIVSPGSKTKPDRPLYEVVEEILELVRMQSRQAQVELLGTIENMSAQSDNSIVPVEFLVGTRVRHPKFGVGLVVKRQGNDDEVKLTVNFPGFGQKSLLQKFSNLERA